MAKEVFLNIILPVVGGIVATILFSSPLKAVLEARRAGEIGVLNPLPFVMTMANCVCWTVYAYLIDDWFLVVPNAIGFLIGLALFLSAHSLGIPDVRQRDRLHIICVVLASTLFIVSTLERMVITSHDTKELLWGYTANTMLVFFFLSPLSTLFQVMRTRDSASIVLPLSVMNILNGTLWMTYGLVISDAFVWVPNATGAFLGVIQTTLKLVFPSRQRNLVYAPILD